MPVIGPSADIAKFAECPHCAATAVGAKARPVPAAPGLLFSGLVYPILQIDPHGDNGHMGHTNRMKLPFRTSLDAAEQYLGRLQSRNYSVREFL